MSDLINDLRYEAQGELFGDTLLEEAADRIEQLEAELRDIRAGHTVTTEFNLAPTMKEGAIRDKLVELGWGTPERIAELEAALREIVLYAKPKYRSTRDKLVRDGVCLSGGLLHYESMPHVIHAGKKVLLREKDDE